MRWIKEQVKTKYTITDLGPLKTHLGVSYKCTMDQVGEYFEMSMTEFTKLMIHELKNSNSREAKTYLTPAFPGTSLSKLEEDRLIVELDKYRTFARKLLWLVKNHAVDCSNVA